VRVRFPQQPADRWALAAVVVSVLVGLYVRILEPVVEPVADAATYTKIASAFTLNPVTTTTSDWSVTGLAMRGVTYPLFVAMILTVFGSLSAVAWMQSIVVVPATVALLHLTGRRTFSPGTGALAAWMYALWLPAQIYTSLIMQETWLALLVTLLLFLLSRCITGGGWPWSVATGLLLAVLALSHAAFQFLGIALVVVLALHRWAFDRGRQRQTLVTALALLAVMVPSVLVRQATGLPQAYEGGHGVGSGGGWAFWIGTHADLHFREPSDGWKFGDITEEGEFARVLADVRSGALATDPHLTEIILSKADSEDLAHETLTDGDFYRAGFANLLDHPTAWPEKIAVGMSALTTIPPGISLYRTADSPAAVGAPWTLLAVLTFAAAFVAIVLLTLLRRPRLIMAAPFLLQLVVLLIARPENRYAIPLWTSCMLLAAVAVGYTRSALRHLVSAQRDPLPTVRIGVIVAAVALLATGVGHSAATPEPSGSLPQTRAQAELDRTRLRQIVFGSRDLPVPDVTWVADPSRSLPSSAVAVNSAEVQLRFGLGSTLIEYLPQSPTGCGLIVHGGHGSWQDAGGLQVAEDALDRGCRVIAADMPAAGVNRDQIAELNDGSRLALRQPDGLHGAFWSLDTPWRSSLDLFLAPVIAAVDRMAATTSDPVTVAGLSGGGWTASVAAALDPRIARSLNVSGSTVYVAGQPCPGDYEECLPTLYEEIPMQTIYTLSASGTEREAVQVLHYYDPCCYAGEQGSWAASVQQAVESIGAGGQYRLVVDRTKPGQHAYMDSSRSILDNWLS